MPTGGADAEPLAAAVSVVIDGRPTWRQSWPTGQPIDGAIIASAYSSKC